MGYLYSWMVCFMETPDQKWMMTGGIPMSQEKIISQLYADEPDSPLTTRMNQAGRQKGS